jgi:sRNA-binding carbon storage regulator CsrA
MDAYEKLFVKMEAERKLAEEEESKDELSCNAEGDIRPSVLIQEDIKPPDQVEVKKKLSNDTENKKTQTTNTEDKIDHSANIEEKRKALEKAENGKNKSPEIQAGRKSSVRLKALKLTNGAGRNIDITDSALKDCKLGKNILIIDAILEENNSREDILTTIENKGIEYVIAPGFASGFYEKTAGNGLRLIKCSDAWLIDEGSNIEVFMEEGVIFDVDSGQEYRFNPALGSDKRSIIQTMRLGECLRIGLETKIKVLSINSKQIKVKIYDLKVITINTNKSISISDDISIKAVKIEINEFKLQIVAPEYKTIKKSWCL